MAMRSGSEKSVYQDPETGRTIWRLTNSHVEDKHSYYDICPWSPDGKQILYNSAQTGTSQLYLIPMGE